MLRADNVICGTSSTGTGTLTLAACPSPPGGLDFDKWLKATGFNFVSGNALLVSYTIIEYTDATFATAKQTEKGVGTLTLGASITAATLARTTVQSIATGLNATPSPTYSAPTAITIGTAANTLVFVGASTFDTVSTHPYTSDLGGSGWFNACYSPPQTGVTGTVALTSGTDYYQPFEWRIPMLIKKVGVRVGGVAYTGGTANLYGRLYDFASNGKPGKLLYDFGALGTAGSAFASTTVDIASAGGGAGFLLLPGEYYLDLLPVFSGGSGSATINMTSTNADFTQPYTVGRLGAQGMGTNFMVASATGGNATAPDPANVTAWGASGLAQIFLFALG